MKFKLEDLLYHKYMSYELVKDEIEYSADDITKIVFKEIICDKNINKKIY